MRLKWLFFQVGLPLIGPVVIGAGVAVLWLTGASSFEVQWPIIVDTTPRALTFYNIVLLTSTAYAHQDTVVNNLTRLLQFILIGFASALYHSFTVIWRHDPEYTLTTQVYVMALILTVLTIVICMIVVGKKPNGA